MEEGRHISVRTGVMVSVSPGTSVVTGQLILRGRVLKRTLPSNCQSMHHVPHVLSGATELLHGVHKSVLLLLKTYALN
jgi:hypothetical protein